LAYGWRPLGVKWGRSTVNLASYLSPFGTTSSNLAHAAGGRTEPSLARALSLAVVASAQVARARGKLQELLRKLRDLVEKLREYSRNCVYIFFSEAGITPAF